MTPQAPPSDPKRFDRSANPSAEGEDSDIEPAPVREALLQELLGPAEGFPARLYLRAEAADGSAILAPTAADGALDLVSGATLSTDTFFGSFYRAYWHSVADIDQIAVSVVLHGRAQLRVMEECGRHRSCVLETEVDSDGKAPLRMVPGLATLAPDEDSRLWVEIRAKTPCRIARIDWLTDRSPLRQTTLSIGLCTFNQEAYLSRTLTRLIALTEAMPQQILRIHLVNQGASFASPDLAALCLHPKVQLIQQRNLGGSGGFTRGLVEEMAAADPASHQLLMDDDILLDERMIARALRFLDFAKAEIALGAGMFDSLRPEVMYEAGAWLRDSNRIEPYCHDVNLAEPGQLWRFGARVRTDYNAWWFCILPLAAVRRVDLPVPVFIRGDDFEYGQRLAEAGVATVTLPGIGVWHEPFHAKPTGWQDYYDLRNRLIFAATHPGKVRQLSLPHVAGLIATAILTHNYPSARLRLRAVTDFLTGPAGLLDNPEMLHAGIMALARPNAPERLGPEWAERPVAPRGRPKPDRMAPLVIHMVCALLVTALMPFRPRERVILDRQLTPLRVAGRTYVVTNVLRGYHLRFVPKRLLMWQLLFQALQVSLRYRRQGAAADAVWKAAIQTYSKPAWWQACFQLRN